MLLPHLNTYSKRKYKDINVSESSNLDTALTQMEAAALNFASRNINDASVRQSCIPQTRGMSGQYRTPRTARKAKRI